MNENTDELLSKAEAAGRLGLSERAVARHAAAGRLTSHYQDKADGGSRVYYRAGEVDALKALLAERHRPGALERPRSDAPAVTRMWAEAAGRTQEGGTPGAVPIGDLLTLSLEEAAALSGLPVAFLERAIAKGRLRVLWLKGHEARVTRRDLRRFIGKL